ncbi:hypothetical protein PAXRUDRAFT_835120 [Paxillus rubicundulus Ve08.2h10]|uniref:Uncharacterized protein n=1 Tax=Paxillus rubicundulus Ve08.2h10 TaxID=930991 RepID=A0A0D0DGN0_9AGAM|nr:hypothetical protein PAXRUDRAFT_835120 [Paxillus rubicundulus Ve08.2h10]
MKTFVTLLATLASLSAYTIVGVHAQCITCRSSMDGAALHDTCITGDVTTCEYENQAGLSFYCYYDSQGSLRDHSNPSCVKNVGTSKGPTCGQCS